MKKTFIWYGIGGVALVLLGVSISLSRTEMDQEVTSSVAPEAAASMTLRDQVSSSLALPVTGVVQAKRQIELATQSSGIISSMLVSEGEVVREGQRLLQQSLPVANANLAATKAESELRRLEQASTAANASSTAAQRSETLSEVRSLAPLRGVVQDTAVTAATKQLTTTLSDTTVTILAILDFYQENQGLFATDDRATYQEIVRRLYGRQPDYFTGGYRVPLQERGDVLAAIQRLQRQSPLDVAAIHTLARTTEVELVALQSLLAGSEAEVYADDQKAVSVDEYTSLRSSLVRQRQALSVALAALRTASTQAEIVTVEVETAENQATTNAALAARQAELSQLMTDATKQMNDARIAQAAAHLSLGTITAPGEGVITEVLLEPGEYAAPGTPAVVFEDQSELKMTVQVPQQWEAQVTPGQSVLRRGDVVGQVTSVVRDSRTAAARITVQITDSDAAVGEVLSGQIAVLRQSEAQSLYALPREYVGFTDQGPVIYTEDGAQRVSIIYDFDDVLYIDATNLAPDTSVFPARGQIFF